MVTMFIFDGVITNHAVTFLSQQNRKALHDGPDNGEHNSSFNFGWSLNLSYGLFTNQTNGGN